MKEWHQLGPLKEAQEALLESISTREHRITERLQMDILIDHQFDYLMEPVSNWDHSVTERIQLGTL